LAETDLIDYAPRFRGSGNERRHLHRIDAAMPAVPPSRALLIAELPVSGRARVRVGVGKLPLFGEPRTRRRFSKQYYSARQKSLLDAGVIWSGCWTSIVLALPEADGAFVDCEHCREVSLCHTGKSPRAQLPTGDEIHTPIGHGRLVIFHIRR
jgi:hypothetical protein